MTREKQTVHNTMVSEIASLRVERRLHNTVISHAGQLAVQEVFPECEFTKYSSVRLLGVNGVSKKIRKSAQASGWKTPTLVNKIMQPALDSAKGLLEVPIEGIRFGSYGPQSNQMQVVLDDTGGDLEEQRHMYLDRISDVVYIEPEDENFKPFAVFARSKVQSNGLILTAEEWLPDTVQLAPPKVVFNFRAY